MLDPMSSLRALYFTPEFEDKSFQDEEQENLLKPKLERQKTSSNPPLVQKALEDVMQMQEEGIISEEEEKRRTQFITCASFDARDHPKVLLYDSDDDENNASAYLPYLEIINVAAACCRRAYQVITCGCCIEKNRLPPQKRWGKGAESEL